MNGDRDEVESAAKASAYAGSTASNKTVNDKPMWSSSQSSKRLEGTEAIAGGLRLRQGFGGTGS
jgi:hypothetical protein